MFTVRLTDYAYILFQVYAIEASNLSNLCKVIVRQNQLDDVIEVVHGRVEDVVLPIKKADILISEWMGFYLLHEAMLNSVIVARDRWLSIHGLMVPSTATIYLAPVQMVDHYKENFLFWTKAYGCDLSPIAELVKQKSLAQPSIIDVKADNVLAEPELVCHLDLMYVAAEDLKTVQGNFGFTIQKNAVCHGFACWFDCLFEGDEDVELSTGPAAQSTHWQQTVLFLPDAYFVNDGEVLSCQFKMEQDTRIERRYNLSLEIVEEESEAEEADMEEEEDEEDEEQDEDEINRKKMKQAILDTMQNVS